MWGPLYFLIFKARSLSFSSSTNLGWRFHSKFSKESCTWNTVDATSWTMSLQHAWPLLCYQCSEPGTRFIISWLASMIVLGPCIFYCYTHSCESDFKVCHMCFHVCCKIGIKVFDSVTSLFSSVILWMVLSLAMTYSKDAGSVTNICGTIFKSTYYSIPSHTSPSDILFSKSARGDHVDHF